MSKQLLIDGETSSLTPHLWNINLRHLCAFLAVAETGSVTKAAEALFRVTSAVTRAVAELEATLGLALFDRRARGMLLNTFGQAVLSRARRVEGELLAACHELAATAPVDGRAVDARSLMAALFSSQRMAVFAGLAELHNMPAVARLHGISQPAISGLVRELESRFGRPLFMRSARGVTPTREGSMLAFRFRRALSELRSIPSDLAALDGVIMGHVTVGALPLGRTRLIPQAIASVVARHPALHISTVESPYEALAALLRSGDVDFIFGALRPVKDAKDLSQEALFQDRMSLVVRAGHPLTRSTAPSLAELEQSQWVLSRPGSPARQLLERSFSSLSWPVRRPVVETGDLAILRGLLLETDMVTAISAHQLHYEIASGALVVLDVDLAQTERDIGLVQRSASLPSPGSIALMAEIRKVAAAHMQG